MQPARACPPSLILVALLAGAATLRAAKLGADRSVDMSRKHGQEQPTSESLGGHRAASSRQQERRRTKRAGERSNLIAGAAAAGASRQRVASRGSHLKDYLSGRLASNASAGRDSEPVDSNNNNNNNNSSSDTSEPNWSQLEGRAAGERATGNSSQCKGERLAAKTRRSLGSRPKLGGKLARKVSLSRVVLGAQVGSWAYRRLANWTGGECGGGGGRVEESAGR